MSRGQLARTPANFPRMKVRSHGRQTHRPVEFAIIIREMAKLIAIQFDTELIQRIAASIASIAEALEDHMAEITRSTKVDDEQPGN